MTGIMISLRGPLIVCCLMFAAGTAEAATIHSNGAGGGHWSRPETWRGGKVPAAEDKVVVASRDTVVFDVSRKPAQDKELGAAVCAGLELDPLGVLTFGAGDGEMVLSVAGAIDCHGTIKIEATRSRGTRELRLVANDEKERAIFIRKNGALLIYGAGDLGNARRNVLITSPGSDEENDRRCGTLKIERASLDMHNAAIRDVRISASMIDNTGYTAHQRLNVVGNIFTGWAAISLDGCDTPVIKNNVFELSEKNRLNVAAIRLRSCQLAQVSGNRIAGNYERGILIEHDTDSALTGNSISGCRYGLHWHGTNGIIKRLAVSDCDQGIHLQMSGIVEEASVARAAATGINIAHSKPQLTTCRISETGEKGTAMVLHNASVMLVNTNLAPEMIRTKADPLAEGKPWAECFQYLVVEVKGGKHRKTQVSVRTTGLADDAADPNVVNSPAMVYANDMTPLPRTHNALMVRTWTIAADGKTQPAPTCAVRVWDPPTHKEEPATVRARKEVVPDKSWFRPEPNADKPTVRLDVQ